eukprot:COSAG02_NODE_36546_length_453_cov_0.895480_1_plen_122_part_01
MQARASPVFEGATAKKRDLAILTTAKQETDRLFEEHKYLSATDMYGFVLSLAPKDQEFRMHVRGLCRGLRGPAERLTAEKQYEEAAQAYRLGITWMWDSDKSLEKGLAALEAIQQEQEMLMD